MRALSESLWHQRDILELLAHRLETEWLLVHSGRTRRLALSMRETDAVLAEATTAELARAVTAQAAAQVLGLPENAPLREISRLAPEPWGQVLAQHREAMVELAEEITSLARSTAQDADGGEAFLDSVRESMDDSAVVDPAAEDSELTDAVIQLQLQELSRQAAEARGHVLQQSLVDFLG